MRTVLPCCSDSRVCKMRLEILLCASRAANFEVISCRTGLDTNSIEGCTVCSWYWVIICLKLSIVIVSGKEGSHEGGGRLVMAGAGGSFKGLGNWVPSCKLSRIF